nr:protein transport protein sec39 [Quercus suber]
MAKRLYLPSSDDSSVPELPKDVVEGIVLAKALEAYDSASNGNKTRGGVKKANDISRFHEVGSLIAATHALSFYSLTLHHGVPFQPVSIRVSKDPIRLLDKVLEQNPRSYTKLDDLISIGTNLVSADLQPDTQDNKVKDPKQVRRETEHRVTFMAVEAALRENDFETAYSYIMNRLTPSDTELTAPSNINLYSPTGIQRNQTSSLAGIRSRSQQPEDDISWRAAFLAGRYRPSSSSPHTLRRLEQRTELLSLALVLAPASALTEILGAWRRCEEETTALQRAEHQAEREFDDLADKRVSTATLPGHFTVSGEQPALVLNQKRRELGRPAGLKGEAEAPMSMFDLTRSAASALSRNAFPLSRSGNTENSTSAAASPDAPTDPRSSAFSDPGSASPRPSLDGSQRVRRRDMVANAVSGSLVSGLGWVLGATPADAHAHQSQQE